jgi:uncharacterized protein involved in outer membrane biogenesis
VYVENGGWGVKWIRRVILGLVLVLVLVIAALIFRGGRIIQHSVETVGPKITGVPITLERAFFYPVRGRAGLAGVTISNPEGYKTSHWRKLGKITIELDKSTIGKKDLVINRIEILEPDINYEMSLTGSNLKAFLQGMSGEEGDQKKDEGESSDQAEKKTDGRRVIIEELRVVDGKVRISSKMLQGLNAPIPLPDIKMTGIGKEKGGASMAEVIGMVTKEIAGSVTKVAAGALNIAGDGVEAVGKGALAVGEGAADGAKAVGTGATKGLKAVGSGAGSLLKGVGGLLGGEKDDVKDPAEE